MDKARILIVDDSNTKRSIYKDMMVKEGYFVIEAVDGEDGIKKARSEFPDVIITDLAMPNMDGFKMVEMIKKDERTKYVPVICVSATYKDIVSKMRALNEIGAEEYFYMPENTDDLLLKVKVMLRVRHLYTELLEKNKQLKTFNTAAVDRELRMVELKKKIKSLEEELTKYRK